MRNHFSGPCGCDRHASACAVLQLIFGDVTSPEKLPQGSEHAVVRPLALRQRNEVRKYMHSWPQRIDLADVEDTGARRPQIEGEFDRERPRQLRTMTLDEGAKVLVGVMDVSKAIVQM